MVIAEIAISAGRSVGSTRSRAITTEVSTSPRGWRASGTGGRVLVDHRVDILAEPFASDGRSAREQGDRGPSIDEPAPPQGAELADGDPVAGHDEGLTTIEGTHDLAALVAELSLRDLATHPGECSTSATGSHPCLRPPGEAPPASES